jgi:hypothetical protein
MIKNTIIAILLIVLVITIYSYICLSSNIMNYEKERMEFILNKESDIKNKESKLQTMTKCNDELIKYKNVINKITSDLANLN